MANRKYQAIEQYWHRRGPFGVISRATLRTLQFVFAIVIAALYGVDLTHASKHHLHGQTEWIYAEFVVALSAITCAVHCFFMVVHVAWVTWDTVLFVLWMAQVGVFGNIYIRHDSDIQQPYVEATQSITRMRAAVWIGLINMLLWLLTTVLGVAWCIRTRKVTRRTDKDEQEQEQALQRLREEDIETGITVSEKREKDSQIKISDVSNARDEKKGLRTISESHDDKKDSKLFEVSLDMGEKRGPVKM
ncbi:hypothetical protein N7509_001202 [Penicillium cosmopolitanum]|uniref:MARVEL domain-containing protein n=1 Tax=Penicillium cosmopolitanum TaxID=1131564 RepID=A0A9X0BEW5_9EURO|nr:uncharacterized protein N7509_001202 [Penicillium cosmopolitanum]KAJ5414575.1 hypothetical protein N7509_001202 [Penicillium cosmopolitanum]